MTIVGCVERLDGDVSVIEYIQREVGYLRELYGSAVDFVLVGNIPDVERIESPLASLGIGLVQHGGDMVVLASQVTEFEVEMEDGVTMVKQKPLFCQFCNIGFRSPAGLLQHRETGRHKKNLIFHYYQTHRDTLLTSPHELGLEVEVEGAEQGVECGQEKGLVVITAKPNEPKAFKLRLKNVRTPEGDEDADPKNKPRGIVLESLGLAKEDDVFTLHDEKGLTLDGTKLRLKYNLKFRVSVRACSSQIGHYRMPVIVGFYHEIHSQRAEETGRYVLSHMAVELLLRVQTDEMKDLKPTAPFRQPKKARKWQVRETVVGKKTIKDNSEDNLRKVKELDHYIIKKTIKDNSEDNLRKVK